jgi:hypothetical protein
VVEDFVRRGMTEEEALAQPLDVPCLDPYPHRPAPLVMSDALNGRNVSNIYKHAVQRSIA